MWAEMHRACLFIVEGWAHTGVRCEKCVWEARQVGTAARPAIESVVIAATAVLAIYFDRTRALTKKSPKVSRDAPKTI